MESKDTAFYLKEVQELWELSQRKYESVRDGFSIVYVLFNIEKPIYVGQTKTLQNRVLQHYKEGKLFTDVVKIQVLDTLVNDIESELIVKYQTKLNVTLPNNSRYCSEPAFRDKIAKLHKDLKPVAIERLLELALVQPVFISKYRYYDFEASLKRLNEIKDLLMKLK